MLELRKMWGENNIGESLTDVEVPRLFGFSPRRPIERLTEDGDCSSLSIDSSILFNVSGLNAEPGRIMDGV